MATIENYAKEIRQTLRRMDAIPPMPTIASECLQLRAKPRADLKDLVAIIERDPGLSAYILRYAQMALFGYGSRITSVHEAVSLVLGYDMALHLSVGMSLGRTLRAPRDGLMGAHEVWRHGIYSAQLARRMVAAMPLDRRTSAGLSYLSGLLHNIGILAVGHLYPQALSTLNVLLAHSRDISVSTLELHIFGVSHGQIGAWLLEAWEMPEELIIAAREHHHADYGGRHTEYAQLTLITDRLLLRYGIGDAATDALPQASLAQLGLTECQALAAAQDMLKTAGELDTLADQLAA